MKKTVILFLALCLSVTLCACASQDQTAQPKQTTLPELAAVEIAQEHIDNGQYEEAYAVLYNTENRTTEEEQLFKRFSFVKVWEEHKADTYRRTTKYNDNGLKTENMEESASGVYLSVYTYDTAGNLISQISQSPDGSKNSIFLHYDENGNCVKQILNDGWELVYTNDADGNLIEETLLVDGKPNWTKYYTYDAEGRISEVKNGQGIIHMYDYDVNGRLIKESQPKENSETIYIYDDNGNLTKEADYKNGTETECTVYTYNDAGFAIQKVHYTDGIEDRKYDWVKDEYGNALSSTYNGKTSNCVLTYDDYGNLLQADWGSDSYIYSYKLIYREN